MSIYGASPKPKTAALIFKNFSIIYIYFFEIGTYAHMVMNDDNIVVVII